MQTYTRWSHATHSISSSKKCTHLGGLGEGGGGGLQAGQGRQGGVVNFLNRSKQAFWPTNKQQIKLRTLGAGAMAGAGEGCIRNDRTAKG